MGLDSPLGMAGIHRSSTLLTYIGPVLQMLGMAGIHRSSTLSGCLLRMAFG